MKTYLIHVINASTLREGNVIIVVGVARIGPDAGVDVVTIDVDAVADLDELAH